MRPRFAILLICCLLALGLAAVVWVGADSDQGPLVTVRDPLLEPVDLPEVGSSGAPSHEATGGQPSAPAAGHTAVPNPEQASQPVRKPTPDAPPAAPPPTSRPDPGAGAGGVYTPPAAIAADCSVDVTEQLNAWLAPIPDGATVRLGAGACYRAERTVQVAGKRGWTIEGNGAELRRTEVSSRERRYPRSNAHLRLVGTDGVTVRDLQVTGTNDGRDLGGSIADAEGHGRKASCYVEYGFTCYTVALEFEHGLDLRGAPGTTLERVSIDAVWGDGVYVSGGDQFASAGSDGTRLVDVTVSRNGRQGIAIVRSSDVLVERAVIVSSRRSGVDIEPDATREVIRGITVRNSTVCAWLLAFASKGRGNVSDVRIEGNTVDCSGVPWVYVNASDDTPRENWTIVGNTVNRTLGSPQPAMLFEDVDNVLIEDNTVSIADSQSRWFVGIARGSGFVIRRNDVRNATTERLYAVDGRYTAPGVVACGNVTADGESQPRAC